MCRPEECEALRVAMTEVRKNDRRKSTSRGRHEKSCTIYKYSKREEIEHDVGPYSVENRKIPKASGT